MAALTEGRHCVGVDAGVGGEWKACVGSYDAVVPRVLAAAQPRAVGDVVAETLDHRGVFIGLRDDLVVHDLQLEVPLAEGAGHYGDGGRRREQTASVAKKRRLPHVVPVVGRRRSRDPRGSENWRWQHRWSGCRNSHCVLLLSGTVGGARGCVRFDEVVQCGLPGRSGHDGGGAGVAHGVVATACFQRGFKVEHADRAVVLVRVVVALVGRALFYPSRHR